MYCTVLGSINSMIHVSWYVSWYKNSIKYQVSWYIFDTVSLIHFGCRPISIINHWHMTVIHLRRTTKKAAAVNTSSTVSATVSPIQTMQPTVWVKKSPPEVIWIFFHFFHKRLRIFNRFFTHLIHVSMYARLQIFTQLSPTLTKLCHIKRDYL